MKKRASSIGVRNPVSELCGQVSGPFHGLNLMTFENIQRALDPLQPVTDKLAKSMQQMISPLHGVNLNMLENIQQALDPLQPMTEKLAKGMQQMISPLQGVNLNMLENIQQALNPLQATNKKMAQNTERITSGLITPQAVDEETAEKLHLPEPREGAHETDQQLKSNKSWYVGIVARFKTNDGPRISRPPGSLLNNIAEFLCSPKTLDRVVNPILSDMQVEYCEALAAGRDAKANWVRMRGYWAFFKALGLYSLLKTAADIWRKVISG